MFNLTSIFSGLLIATRLGVFMLATPVVSQFRIPTRIKVLLCVSLSFVLGLGLPSFETAIPQSAVGLFLLMANESAAGLALAIPVASAFAAFSVASRLIDVQIGFGIGQVFDPVTRRQTPVLSALMGVAWVAVLFITDGHLLLIRVFADLLLQWPPGASGLDRLDLSDVLAAGARTYGVGITVLAPIVMALLLVEIGLGMLARSMPQMNVFVVGIPVKILVGLATFAAWTPHLPLVLGQLLPASGANYAGWGQ